MHELSVWDIDEHDYITINGKENKYRLTGVWCSYFIKDKT